MGDVGCDFLSLSLSSDALKHVTQSPEIERVKGKLKKWTWKLKTQPDSAKSHGKRAPHYAKLCQQVARHDALPVGMT